MLAGLDGSCEVRLCDPCALVRPRVPCVSRVCPGSSGVFLPVAGCVLWVWMDGCEVRLCEHVPLDVALTMFLPCVSRLPPVSFYGKPHERDRY